MVGGGELSFELLLLLGGGDVVFLEDYLDFDGFGTGVVSEGLDGYLVAPLVGGSGGRGV